MEKNINPVKKKLSEQLPTHSPDPGLWKSLSSQLDMIDADAALRENLAKLPVHSPDQGTWNSILFRLNRIAYYKTGLRVAFSVAAGLLLFFTVSRFTGTDQNSIPPQPVSVNREPATISSNQDEQSAPAVSQVARPGSKKTGSGSVASNGNGTGIHTLSAPQAENNKAEEQPLMIAAQNNAGISSALPEKNVIASEPPAQTMPVNEAEPVVAENYNINTGPRIVPHPTETGYAAVNPVGSNVNPLELNTGKNKNYFALAVNYLPENVYNGSENVVFHNVDLTASYNKEKVRYNTSLGMAYNEDQFEFFMNYDVKTPVTSPGPGGSIDTVSYTVSNMDSEYQGTEKHQYITYNLGLGKRLFSIGKFTSWINAGAGFGIQINNPDLIAATAQSIKGQPNAQINSVITDKPQYSDYNINFATGIDFNYQIIKRLSISFAPTSRWYFKPMITQDNQPTDELSLGFRTGMKFNF